MLHQIGIGTLGPVFRTYEPIRDRLVAVKAFRLDIVPEQAQALAAALSRAAQASLFHPSIVEPIEAGVEGTVAYRAEEYVAAESLDVAMRHYAPAPIEKVLPFITQLAGAIDFARAAGIGHGGLHPRDIFVTPDDARATGFGVVEALEQVGIRAPIRRPYSAPERIDGRAWGTPADVFSLAAITFELLTGKRPAGTGAQIGALPDGRHTAALQTVLARAMDDEPSRRHASALAFAGALEAAAHGRRITEISPVPIPVVPGPPAAEPPAPESKIPSPDILKPDIPKPDLLKRDIAPPAAAPPVLPTAAEVDAAAAAVVEPQVPLFEPDLEIDEPPVVDPMVEDPVVPTPGEFDIESALDSADTAGARTLGHRSAQREGGLFDDDDVAGTATTALPSEGTMFRAVEPESHLHDVEEPSRSPILPYALLLVLGLLVGFAGGYFMGSRDRLPDATSTPAADTPPETAPAPATSDNAGQYSEQKVARTTPPPTTSTAAAPPPARPAPAPAAAAKGQIVVHSVPPRAGVTVNGTWRGRTPLTLDGVAFGNYLVRVVQPGYKVAREEFTLSAREPTRTFTARLERAGPAAPAPTPAPTPTPVPIPAPRAAAPPPAASFTGTLYVDSRPRGAKVFIDGKSAGQTPLSVPEVAAGSHVVRIEMDGKKTVTATPRVIAGQTERVTVSLEDKQH